MDYLDLPINKDEHLAKLIENTEEIIKNFKELSELMITKNENKNDTMYKLGRNIINEYEPSKEATKSLGNNQIKYLF